MMIESVLTEAPTLFVGSSLTDPDMVSYLAESAASSHPARYSITFRPQLGLSSERDAELAADLYRMRFRHLGVEPILVDYAHQVPQLIREVALKARKGDHYLSYMSRVLLWWSAWRDKLGCGDQAARDAGLLEMHHEFLRLMRDRIAPTFTDLDRRIHHRASDERIMIELWIRDPVERLLRHWCSSEGVWYEPTTAHMAQIAGPVTYLAQSTFREGRVLSGPLAPSRGHWRYHLSTPTVLQHEPWEHLPVGVISVLSSRDDGGLWYTSRQVDLVEDLTDSLKALVNELLDPGAAQA